MSQHDLTIANQGFPAFRADLNSALQALGSCQSGTSAPSPTFANQLWYDTTNNILKIRNEDNDAWISIATLDQSTDAISSITATTLNGSTVNAGALNATGNTILGDASTDTLNVGNGGLVKDSSGNVGVGTATPTGKLNVITDNTHSNGATFDSTGTTQLWLRDTDATSNQKNWGFQISGGDFNIIRANDDRSSGFVTPISFAQAPANSLFINSSGIVGMGTSNPTAVTGFVTNRNVLQVTSSSSYGQIRIGGVSGAMIDHDDASSTVTTFRNLYGATDAAALIQIQSGYLTFGTGTSYTERMRINAAGNLCVGTTSDIARVGVGFDGASNNGCVLRTTTNASGTGFLYFQQDTNTCGSVVRVGATSAVTYSSTSDYRLKENVLPMTDGLDKVARLKPVTYTWKQGGESAEGFIAHELAEVCPDAVVGTKDEVETYLDDEGNEQTRPKYQSIDTSFLVATLTAAIQELNAKVDAQSAEIQLLKGAK